MDDTHAVVSAGSSEPAASGRLGFLRALVGLLVMAVLYGAIYFPYPAGSWPVALLLKDLELVAAASASVIRLWDPSVTVIVGPTISGRFPMQIVLDCAALDVQALYLAAVLVFPTTWRNKLWGGVLGLTFLASANVARIATLYFVGAYAPARFDLIHEDLLAFVMVALTCATYLMWMYGVQRALKPGLTQT